MPASIPRLRLLVPVLAAVVWPLTAARAQPAAPPDAISVRSTVSYSGTTDLDGAGQSLGDVSITLFQFAADSSVAVGPGLRLGYGLDYTHLGLDGSAAAPLPGELQSFAVPLSLGGRLAPDWFGRVIVSPGLYGSSLDLSADTFNAPVAAFATYRQSPTLAWTLGLRYDAWSEYPLLPLAGVAWTFAPGWELSVGLPRTGISWQFRPDATLRVGASFQGGTYYVKDDPRPAGSPLPWLGRTQLDYREVRVGAALDLFARGPVGLVLEAGAIVNQRFNYDRGDLSVHGGSAAYATLTARFRF